jgi:hypothetical protein
MRQAAAKEKLAELEEQQRQVDDASKWRLPDTEKHANVAPSSKLRVIQGVGFHVIDSSSEDLPALAGRRSWGRFNEVCNCSLSKPQIFEVILTWTCIEIRPDKEEREP